MKSRRGRLRAVIGLAVAIGLAQAHPATPPYRVGIITDASPTTYLAAEGLKDGLRESGLVEGRDVTYDVRFAREKRDAVAAAQALASTRVDLIFAGGESATLAAKNATQHIPVVFALVGDPVKAGLVASLPYPGGNLTGISSRTPELAPKRLEFLKTAVPGLRRVWFVYYSGDATDFGALENLYGPARQLGLELLFRPVNDAQQLAHALQEVRPGDAMLSPAGDALDIPSAVHQSALRTGVPAIFGSAIWVAQGALASYGPDSREQGMQAARLAARILRGARPQDLPVEGAEHIRLALNLKRANLLGLPVAARLIFRADVVYR